MIVYICIGNSDDKLSQAEWAGYIEAVDRALGLGLPRRSDQIQQPLIHVHGRWFSAPDVPWQSACWCIEFDPDAMWALADGTDHNTTDALHHGLTNLASLYHQDSIAWAQAPITELIRPLPPQGFDPPITPAPVTGLEDPT